MHPTVDQTHFYIPPLSLHAPTNTFILFTQVSQIWFHTYEAVRSSGLFSCKSAQRLQTSTDFLIILKPLKIILSLEDLNHAQQLKKQ